MKPFLAFVFLLAAPLLAWPAAAGDSGAAAVVRERDPAPVCAPARGLDALLAQASPLDCCKANKGVCGCRAGKIVCCDGSVSKVPACTCHGESAPEN